MIYHSRAEWQSPSQPVTGPAISWPKIVRIVIHYNGGNLDAPYNSAQHMRNSQNYYVTQKGYSLGYNWVVDYKGEIWESRGFDIKCAANVEVNDSSVAIEILVDNQDAANPAQINAVRELVAEIRRRQNKSYPLVKHSTVATNSTNTICPGAGISPQVDGGVFEPVSVPPVTPGNIGKAMIIDYLEGTDRYTRFVTNFTEIAWVFDGVWAGVVGGAGLPIVKVNRDQLLSAIKSLKPTTQIPWTIADDGELAGAWNAPRPD